MKFNSENTQQFDAAMQTWFVVVGGKTSPGVVLNSEQDATAKILRDMALEYELEVWTR